MSNRDILAIGTSAGGVEALVSLAKGFHANFPASILVTIHLQSQFASSLDDILSRAGPLSAAFATDGEILKKARMYIAPPGRHLLVDGDRISLGIGPRENKVRPAIDPMLRSAAVCCGYRTVGVVLTGTLSDGASGLSTLNLCGGITVVQDPHDAAFAEMPLRALDRVAPHHVSHLAQMPALLYTLAHEPAGTPRVAPVAAKYEVEIARRGCAGMGANGSNRPPFPLSCPDCGAVLREVDDGRLAHYRCHVGHAYTAHLTSPALATTLLTIEERLARMRTPHRRAVGKTS
jgi:two-component system chemotaxis response regulator CheB